MGRKMKLLTAVCLVLLLTFCAACSTSHSNNNESTTEEDDYYYSEEDTEDVLYVDSEEIVYDEEGDSEDELEQLRSEISDDGVVYLIRNGNTYSLSDRLYEVDGIDYYSSERFAGTNALLIYTSPFDYNGTVMFYSVGDVPVPVLQEEDKVVIHSSDNVPTLMLKKVNFYGDCICFHHGRESDFFKNNPGETVGYYDSDTGEHNSELKVANVEVKDSDGEIVDDYYNLNRGDYYTASWYKGTEYEEHSLRADGRAYTFEPGVERNMINDPDYEIEAELPEDGAVYDLSDIPPGIYRTHSSSGYGGGLIEIQ